MENCIILRLVARVILGHADQVIRGQPPQRQIHEISEVDALLIDHTGRLAVYLRVLVKLVGVTAVEDPVLLPLVVVADQLAHVPPRTTSCP